MGEKKYYTVDGFAFEDRDDYETARKEKEGIKYLNKQIDLNDPEKTLKVYMEIMEKNIFKTPVGLQYMYRLRHCIEEKGIEVTPIIIKHTDSDTDTKHEDDREYIKLDKLYKKKCESFRTSAIFNVVLAAAIIAMLIISATSGSVTILNYREKIENQYSQWDTRLKE